jgi:hypothetical protein
MELAVLAKKACVACPEISERDMTDIIREVFGAMKEELLAAPDGKVKFLPLGTVHVITREVDNQQTGNRSMQKRYNLVIKE